MTQWRPKNPHKKDERRFGFPYICISIFWSPFTKFGNDQSQSNVPKTKKPKDWFGGGWPI